MMSNIAIASAVMLIDDDDNAHSMLRYHLDRAGFNLISAKEATAALNLIEQHDLDLLVILLDIHIPRPDMGWALLDQLAKLKENLLAKTPIIVYSVDDDKERARLLGADDHFVKPVNHKTLIALIENYAQQRRASDLD